MLYFIGGANNDQDGWNYIERFKTIFESEGILPVKRVNASRGKASDVYFTATASYQAWYPVRVSSLPNTPPDRTVAMGRIRDHDDIAAITAKGIIDDLYGRALSLAGEQVNLMGYSYGSVLMAHVALMLTDNAVYINNLILIGSPIPETSPLYQTLKQTQYVQNVIRYDIPGDYLSNPSDTVDIIQGALQNRSDKGPHFDLARADDPQTLAVDEGAQANTRIRELARALRNQGVR